MNTVDAPPVAELSIGVEPNDNPLATAFVTFGEVVDGSFAGSIISVAEHGERLQQLLKIFLVGNPKTGIRLENVHHRSFHRADHEPIDRELYYRILHGQPFVRRALDQCEREFRRSTSSGSNAQGQTISTASARQQGPTNAMLSESAAQEQPLLDNTAQEAAKQEELPPHRPATEHAVQKLRESRDIAPCDISPEPQYWQALAAIPLSNYPASVKHEYVENLVVSMKALQNWANLGRGPTWLDHYLQEKSYPVVSPRIACREWLEDKANDARVNGYRLNKSDTFEQACAEFPRLTKRMFELCWAEVPNELKFRGRPPKARSGADRHLRT